MVDSHIRPMCSFHSERRKLTTLHERIINALRNTTKIPTKKKIIRVESHLVQVVAILLDSINSKVTFEEERHYEDPKAETFGMVSGDSSCCNQELKRRTSRQEHVHGGGEGVKNLSVFRSNKSWWNRLSCQQEWSYDIWKGLFSNKPDTTTYVHTSNILSQPLEKKAQKTSGGIADAKSRTTTEPTRKNRNVGIFDCNVS